MDLVLIFTIVNIRKTQEFEDCEKLNDRNGLGQTYVMQGIDCNMCIPGATLFHCI